MKRPAKRPKLSPAERAHIRVMQQEARRQRLMCLIEQALHDESLYREVMQGEHYDKPQCLHHHGTQWECHELERINATRPASRICFNLPPSAYEAKRLGKFLSHD